MKYILLCLVNVVLATSSQLLFRYGVRDKNFTSVGDVVLALFIPYVFLGVSLLVASTILWLYIVSRIPISQAYPIMALVHPAVLLFGRFLMNEDVTFIRWVGITVIFVGVVLTVK